MLISFNWLKQYIDIKESADTIAEMLTNSGLEVESVEKKTSIKGFDGLLIGRVLTCKKHPNADRLKLTTVDIGKKTPSQIICGAPNVAAGQKVIVATPGTKIYPKNGKPFKIKETKIRGEYSEGMICAEDEIGMGDTHDVIMVLKTGIDPGTPASEYFAALPPTPAQAESENRGTGEMENRVTGESESREKGEAEKRSRQFTDSPIHRFTDSVRNSVGEVIFEIGLTPNRADATSHFGVARELKALLKRKAALPSIDDFRGDNHNNCIDVIVEDHQACPRYAGVTISGITVKKSPEWLQNRLISIGLVPINNIVDITNFVLHECGQPLHAFDADEIIDKKVIVKTLPEGTIFKTLDGVERKLSKEDLMICNTKEPMCIAGILGGEKSGVKEMTKNIFLESAYFFPDHIRKTSQKHGLQTDASFRFERGTDPNMVIYALKRASLLINELAGDSAERMTQNADPSLCAMTSEIVDIYPEPIKNFKVNISYKNVERLIGKNLATGNGEDLKKEIIKILKYLDIEIISEDSSGLKLSVPPYRVDVQREADIIEEFLRIYGYDKIDVDAHLSSSYMANFPKTNKEKIQRNIAGILSGNGFNEIITNSLTNPAYSQKLRSLFPSSGKKSGATDYRLPVTDYRIPVLEEDAIQLTHDIKIINKLSEELSVLRQTLLFSGLEVIAHNINRKQRDLKFYEFGKIYYKYEHIDENKVKAFHDFPDQTGLQQYNEENHLALFMTGNKYSESWQQPHKNIDFHDLKKNVFKILTRLNINNYKISNINNDTIFEFGLFCIVNNKTIVKFGKVKHDLMSGLPGIDLKYPVYYADFAWDVVINILNQDAFGSDIQVEEVPKYPEVRRDLSMILDNNVKFENIKQLAFNCANELLRAVNVFDVYEGKGIDKGKKSYAISFILQDYSQTLTDKVIDKTMQLLMNAFETKLNAKIRKSEG